VPRGRSRVGPRRVRFLLLRLRRTAGHRSPLPVSRGGAVTRIANLSMCRCPTSGDAGPIGLIGPPAGARPARSAALPQPEESRASAVPCQGVVPTPRPGSRGRPRPPPRRRDAATPDQPGVSTRLVIAWS